MTTPKARVYWLTLLGLIGLEVSSWIAWRSGDRIETLVTLGILGVACFVAWRRPAWFAYASVAELVVGGKGYLLAMHLGGFSLSLRMGMFLIVLIRAVPFLVRQWRDLWLSVISRPMRWFVIWLVVSLVIGVLSGYRLNDIYTDSNAWLFLTLLPAWHVLLHRDPAWQSRIMSIVFAGASLVALKSWLMVLLFARDLDSIGTIYRWVRQTGIGEITYINNNIYRVFFQSHIYAALVFVWLLVQWVERRWQRWFSIPLLLTGVGLYISLSRSLWLGLAGSLLFLVLLLLQRRLWRSMLRLWVLIPIAIAAWAMMVWAISWPAFRLGGSSTIASARFTTDGAANAATARQNQIRPLLSAIAQHPVLGSGFGKTVTYFSTDPTINGWRTTTAFELGYLDLWLKFGAVGLALFGWWLWTILRRGYGRPDRDAWLIATMLLFVVHLTSPYINHPLGLGWIMLTTLVLYAI